jgi:hypothetical protein
MDLPYPHLLKHVHLVSSDSAGIKPEPETSIALFPDFFIEHSHMFHPGGALWCDRGKLDKVLRPCKNMIHQDELVKQAYSQEGKQQYR